VQKTNDTPHVNGGMDFETIQELFVRPFYLHLLHANFLRQDRQCDEHFPSHLRLASLTISDTQLLCLFRDKDWRTRLAASWFAGIGRRTRFVTTVSKLLSRSQGAYDVQGFCVALGLMGGDASREALRSYLMSHLPVEADSDHQSWALGAIAYIDGTPPQEFIDPTRWLNGNDGLARVDLAGIQLHNDIVRYLKDHRILKI